MFSMAAAPWNMARRAAIRQMHPGLHGIILSKILSMRTMASARPNMTVEQVNEALSLLRSQPSHYVVASISGRTFVLSNSDLVTLPRIRDVKLGDVLELDLVHEVGSRDYTLRAQDPAHGARNPRAVDSRWHLYGTARKIRTVCVWRPRTCTR